MQSWNKKAKQLFCWSLKIRWLETECELLANRKSKSSIINSFICGVADIWNPIYVGRGRKRHINKIKNKTINEQMLMEQEWIGFDAMDKLNNGTTCKASNKLVFNLFEYWLVMILLLLLIPVLFWLLLSIGITKQVLENMFNAVIYIFINLLFIFWL